MIRMDKKSFIVGLVAGLIVAVAIYIPSFQSWTEKNQRLESENSELSNLIKNLTNSGKAYFDLHLKFYADYGTDLKYAELKIPMSAFMHYREDNSKRSEGRFSRYLTTNDSEIQELVEQVKSKLVSSYSDEQLTDALMSIVQLNIKQIDYDNYNLYPLETLLLGVGDTIDKEYLALTLLKIAKVGPLCAFSVYSTHGVPPEYYQFIGVNLSEPPSHNKLAPDCYRVHYGGMVYYPAMLAGNWRIGDLPPELQNMGVFQAVPV